MRSHTISEKQTKRCYIFLFCLPKLHFHHFSPFFLLDTVLLLYFHLVALLFIAIIFLLSLTFFFFFLYFPTQFCDFAFPNFNQSSEKPPTAKEFLELILLPNLPHIAKKVYYVLGAAILVLRDFGTFKFAFTVTPLSLLLSI